MAIDALIEQIRAVIEKEAEEFAEVVESATYKEFIAETAAIEKDAVAEVGVVGAEVLKKRNC